MNVSQSTVMCLERSEKGMGGSEVNYSPTNQGHIR